MEVLKRINKSAQIFIPLKVNPKCLNSQVKSKKNLNDFNFFLEEDVQKNCVSYRLEYLKLKVLQRIIF